MEFLGSIYNLILRGFEPILAEIGHIPHNMGTLSDYRQPGVMTTDKFLSDVIIIAATILILREFIHRVRHWRDTIKTLSMALLTGAIIVCYGLTEGKGWTRISWIFLLIGTLMFMGLILEPHDPKGKGASHKSPAPKPVNEASVKPEGGGSA